ncbi:hypothetical protein E8E13_001066 [Curvularia kusanoi]|uniref:Uncharacterized protein n=1 Tax=Curvularia kusanoi TaxID=90978 RepID=A0A9P4W6K0_CURKU|nr:hypothetical protein E8E13_001066 [Curvularia kusanoi]
MGFELAPLSFVPSTSTEPARDAESEDPPNDDASSNDFSSEGSSSGEQSSREPPSEEPPSEDASSGSSSWKTTTSEGFETRSPPPSERPNEDSSPVDTAPEAEHPPLDGTANNEDTEAQTPNDQNAANGNTTVDTAPVDTASEPTPHAASPPRAPSISHPIAQLPSPPSHSPSRHPPRTITTLSPTIDPATHPFWFEMQQRLRERLDHAFHDEWPPNEEDDNHSEEDDDDHNPRVTDYNPDHTDIEDETGLGDISRTLRMLPHMTLLAYRQGRAIAGLDTREMDEEIVRRVLWQPQMWPDFFALMEDAGIIDRVRWYRFEELYRLDHEWCSEPENEIAFAWESESQITFV